MKNELRFKIKCLACKKTLSKSYDWDPKNSDLLTRPWYIDERGLKHVALVCLHCGTIHDGSGTILKILLGVFFRCNPFKISSSITPFELGIAIMGISDDAEKYRQIAVDEIGIPESVINVLVERKLLGFAFEKSKTI